MPVVTRWRVGLFVGTGVPAQEKLRIPAAVSARPVRISEPPMIQWTGSIPGTADSKGAKRSKTKPVGRAARKSRGGRAITPAVLVSVAGRSPESIEIAAPANVGGCAAEILGIDN